MPHYSDGTETKTGDIARGRPANVKRDVEGVVIRVTPGETCNLVIGYPKATKVYLDGLNVVNGYVLGPEGPGRVLPVAAIAYDYGDCKNFTLVHRDTE